MEMDEHPETTPRRTRVARLAAAAGALCLVAAACATARVESEPSTAGGAETVSVTLDEYDIRMPRTVAAGRVTFEVRNAGTMEHNFEVEGAGLERSFPTELQPGEQRSLTVSLSPGSYEIYCPVANHADRGMRLQLTVSG